MGHWVLLKYDPEKRELYFFDSYVTNLMELGLI
jgi:hypothetical protein